jgi:2-polyprenyl-3-methyl-5-hydroxy-6-metoxy-1,4-benzoquinol methylase
MMAGNVQQIRRTQECTLSTDLRSAESHFAFGRNWQDYAAKVTEASIGEAVRAMRHLVGDTLAGVRFLDIGCGSGVHALAAARLGAADITGFDIDGDSVEAARSVLSRHLPEGGWRIERGSIFDLGPDRIGTFDVVYSWGVLHHTGDLQTALAQAARLVKDEGRLVIALYRRTWMDAFWCAEKQWYAHASPRAQSRARAAYVALFRLGLAVTGRSFREYLASYRQRRGMEFENDVHDWLGGWPYEPISPPEVVSRLQQLGFEAERVLARSGRLLGRDPGLLGSGCDEYVFRRA